MSAPAASAATAKVMRRSFRIVSSLGEMHLQASGTAHATTDCLTQANATHALTFRGTRGNQKNNSRCWFPLRADHDSEVMIISKLNTCSSSLLQTMVEEMFGELHKLRADMG